MRNFADYLKKDINPMATSKVLPLSPEEISLIKREVNDISLTNWEPLSSVDKSVEYGWIDLDYAFAKKMISQDEYDTFPQNVLFGIGRSSFCLFKNKKGYCVRNHDTAETKCFNALSLAVDFLKMNI